MAGCRGRMGPPSNPPLGLPLEAPWRWLASPLGKPCHLPRLSHRSCLARWRTQNYEVIAMQNTLCIALVLLGGNVLKAQARVNVPFSQRAERVNSLSVKLQPKTAEEFERYEKGRDEWTAQLQSEIEAYLIDTFSPRRLSSESVQEGLRALLSHHIAGKERGNSPFARVIAVDGTPRYLIVGYALWRAMASGTPAVSLRAYSLTDDQLTRLAETGDEMNGYNGLYVEPLTSPKSGEYWFLLYGYYPGNVFSSRRVRAYAFDGRQFRTVWKPDDQLDKKYSRDAVSVPLCQHD